MELKLNQWITLGLVSLGASASAQVPDLLNAFDAGGRCLGMGSSLSTTDAVTASVFANPAGIAFLRRPQAGLSYRNLPTSSTRLRRNLADPDLTTDSQSGNLALSHFGYVLPLGNNAAIGLAYNVGGFIEDDRSAANNFPLDAHSGITVNNYVARIRAKSEFFTVSYAMEMPAQGLNYGIGVTFLRQRVEVRESGILNDGASTPLGGRDGASNGNGVGIIAGIQFIPKNQSNLNIGAVVRTPIDISGNSETAVDYDRVPGVVGVGVAYRRDGLRGGADFAVLAAQVHHHFGGKGGKLIDRNSQTLLGLGLEYNLVRSGFRIPIRLGYQIVGAGGDGFSSRNAFTYGIGYWPNNADFGIDLNYSVPEGGGQDIAIFATYRFK